VIVQITNAPVHAGIDAEAEHPALRPTLVPAAGPAIGDWQVFAKRREMPFHVQCPRAGADFRM